MANVKISDLTAASSVADANQFEINEAGSSKRVTAAQIKTYVGGGTAVYTGLSGTDGTPSGATYLLNASSPSAGDLAYVTANTGLYQNNGNGWYKIATINTSPAIGSVSQTTSGSTAALSNNGTFTLTAGANTVVTITASDADEGTDLVYTKTVTSGTASNVATITQGTGASDNVFTFAPATSVGGTLAVRFDVTDNTNTAQFTHSFTLSFGWAGTQQAELTDTSGGAWDLLGKGVGIDGSTAIVSGSNEAFVFIKSGSTWSQQQKITNSASLFGYAADVSGDYAVVGAYGASTAYVYYRSGTTWSLQATLTGTSGTYFGWSAAIDGDTVVVGAPEEDTTASASGAIYVYTRSGTTWSLQGSMIKASDASGSAQLGYSVDINGDNIIAGAYKDTSNFGAAYVFTRSGTTWSQQQKLTSTNSSSSYEQFGNSVSISGDTCAVGSWLEDTTASDSGAVFMFDRSGTTWGTPTKLKASDAAASDRFGSSVDIDGNMMVIGAQYEDTTATNAGQAYLFSRSGSTWSEDDKVQGSNVMASAGFGNKVAISSGTAIIAANAQTSGSGGSQAGAGAAYIFI